MDNVNKLVKDFHTHYYDGETLWTDTEKLIEIIRIQTRDIKQEIDYFKRVKASTMSYRKVELCMGIINRLETTLYNVNRIAGEVIDG